MDTDVKKKKKEIVLTGDRPTGRLHIGHYAGSFDNRLKMQDEYEKIYIMIADYQAYTDHAEQPELIKDSVIQLMLDYLACGLSPEKNTFFIQSLIPELCEFTMIYANYVTLARLKRNPTVKTEMQSKKYGEAVPVGFLTYPISQAADITAFKAQLVPVGEDQLPMLEQCNEIVRHLRRIYETEAIVECKPILSRAGRLPGTDGQAKMGKSMGNCIYLSDSADDVKTKVMGMFTDPNHLRVEDPGRVEGNPVFTYLDAFDPDRELVAEWKDWYQRGGLGDVKVKRRLVEVLNNFLEPIRQRRQELEQDIPALWDLLYRKSEEARAVAIETLEQLKSDMSLLYR